MDQNKHLKKIAALGGHARWKGKTEKERSKIMKEVSDANRAIKIKGKNNEKNDRV